MTERRKMPMIRSNTCLFRESFRSLEMVNSTSAFFSEKLSIFLTASSMVLNWFAAILSALILAAASAVFPPRSIRMVSLCIEFQAKNPCSTESTSARGPRYWVLRISICPKAFEVSVSICARLRAVPDSSATITRSFMSRWMAITSNRNHPTAR